ncbi:hypothetical protein SNE40_022153 [Patella caerulea]|uniref:Tyr recombinase domain-containing protein n=1 Tax=Patella caerulea TaxID=87958 RepID=A0AAN8G3F4_PATCE
MAFFGFMRCGEFTVKSGSATYNILRMTDIDISKDKSFYIVKLRASKTDPFRQGVSIHIFRNSNICPVETMCKYYKYRINQGALESSPLFVNEFMSTEPLKRDTFIAYVRHLLEVIGYNSVKYCGHSFRIGAATSAAAAGIEDHLIQTLGRWSSNCYVRYIKTSKESLQLAQSSMCKSVGQ